MAQDFRELFLTDSAAPTAAESAEPEAKRRGMFARLRDNLSKTREAFGAEVTSALLQTVDGDTWERLEETLIAADLGAPMTAKVVGTLEQDVDAGRVAPGPALQERLIELLAAEAEPAPQQIDLRHTPTVLMAVGVNGTGKTTTVGKLAHRLATDLGLKVVLGAADTYRAAATEQLQTWGERAGCEVVTGREGADPGSVAFDAVERGISTGADVVLIDTAGRLHNQQQLMEELAKVSRVIGKRLEGAPHETLLTIDSTTGQNGLRQAKLFSEVVPVDGIVLTKLDGTAKGGVALAIAGELGIPVKLIGVGEAITDLEAFDARRFAEALIGQPA